MALSPYSGKYQTLTEDLDYKTESGEIDSREDILSFLEERGVSLEDFISATKRYDADVASGKATNLPGTVGSRILGSFISSGGRLAKFVGDVVAPETTSRLKEAIEKGIPEEKRQQLFDPRSGGLIEEFAQFGAGLIIPGKIASKTLRALPLTRKLPELVRASFSFGVGETFALRPEENTINWLIETVPEIEPYLAKLKVNPKDTEAQQRIDGIIGNSITSGVMFGALKGIFGTGKGAYRLVNRLLQKTGIDLHGTIKSTLTSRMGLTDKTLATQLKRQFAGKKSLEEARGRINKLERIAKEENVESSVLTEALAGEERYLTLLQKNHPKTFTTVLELRGPLDTMSKYVKDNIALAGSLKINRKETFESIAKKLGTTVDELKKLNPDITNKTIANGVDKKIAIPSQLQLIIGKNMGAYLNRSYDIFDNPDFIPDPIARENAKVYLSKFLKNPGEIDSTIEWLTKGMKETEITRFWGGQIPNRTSKILKKKGVIAPEIRALWGEVKDPYASYAKTYTKLARLIAEHKYLRQIAKEGTDEGKILTQWTDKVANKDLTKIGEDALGISSGIRAGLDNPLKGLFSDNAFAKGLAEGTEVMFARDNALMNTFLKLKTFSQAGATIGSIPTHGRNVMGNVFMMVANGTINPIHGFRAMRDSMKRFSSGSSVEFRDKVGRYIELGVIDSSTSAETLKAVAGQAFKSGPAGVAEKWVVGRLGKKAATGLTRVYEAEDNVFKIWNFEELKKMYGKALPNLSKKALEEFAAQRTRDMMPNYALIPKFVKYLRYTPFGNFTAFPSEIMRNVKNLGMNTWKDITGVTAKELGITDPRSIAALRAIGMKRLGGMTVAALAGDYGTEMTKQAFNISDDDVKNIDKTGPAWRQGTAKLFLSNIYDDIHNKLGVDFIDLGPIDPYSYLKKPIRKITERIKNGDEYNEAELNNIIGDAALDIASPFISPSIITEAILKGISGTEGRPKDVQVLKFLKDTGVALTPGTIKFLLKRLEYEQSRVSRGLPSGATAVNRYGYSMPKGSVDLPAFFGLKKTRQDLTTSFKNNIGPLLKLVERSDYDFNKVIGDYRYVKPEDVIKAYNKSQVEKRRSSQILKGVLDSYYALGLDEQRMAGSLTKEGILGNKSADMNKLLKIMANYFEPVSISDRARREAMGKGGAGTPIPLNELIAMYEYYRKLGVE